MSKISQRRTKESKSSLYIKALVEAGFQIVMISEGVATDGVDKKIKK